MQTPATTFDHEDFLNHIFASAPWPSVDETHAPQPPPSDGFVDSRNQQIMMMPLSSHHQNDNVDGSSAHALYNGFSATGSRPFHIPQGSGGGPMHQQGQTQRQPQQQASASTDTGGTAVSPSQSRTKVRARRGQATDPHSIAERLRRERIAERMKALQELVPNGNKTDKASMLDEIIDYVKFLQLQVKVLHQDPRSKELPDGCGVIENSILFTNELDNGTYVYKYGVDTGREEDDLNCWRFAGENRVTILSTSPVVNFRVEY
ncbi:hypothetical protein DY000_02034310 [Brassica cretica]|uniref:BHLH domain-containing protein n=1 Tax=Brassica cretica TaxID=69181 RepID=A0ABQ7DMX8_BRACR|nr:hypothetical protein DY000_02034310 [Brassica cretica]